MRLPLPFPRSLLLGCPVFFLTLLACKAGVDGTCASTSDCKDGLRCLRQVCVDPAAQHRCEQSDGCKDSGRCFAREGACVVGPDADCRKTRLCVSKGLCTLTGGRCAAGSASDCRGSDGCHEAGRCAASAGACVASTEGCRASWGCTNAGRCVARGGRCVAAAAADCRHSTLCLSEGLCALVAGQCAAGGDGDCKGTEICRSHGACQAAAGVCRPRSAAWCRGQTICRELGRCSLDPDGLCVAATDADCRRSAACTRRRRCTADQGECNATTAAAYHKETGALISRLHGAEEAKVAAAASELVQRAWAARITTSQAERIALLMREGDRQWKKSYPGRTRTIQIKHYAGKILAGMGVGQIGPALRREAVAAMRSGARLERRKPPRVKVPLYRRTLNIPGLPKVIHVPKLTPDQAAALARYRKRVILRRRGST